MIPLVVWISLLVPPCTITGTTGNDAITGTPGPDVICTGAGNDIIASGDGNDIIRSGPGRDRVDPGYGRDTVFLGPGNDNVEAVDRQADKLYGGPGIDFAHDDRYDRIWGFERVI